ncbi:MAG TPA: monofunctional biosynthetic peptidoglycan transglycosylase [Steroidobacteraceae bacterium]|nr:monofunctional biosynthetic peptidoglycan transglycosylase [Steroidobacteraceae bacterium]
MAGRRWLRRLGKWFLWAALLWFAGSFLIVLALRWIDPVTSAVMIEDRVAARVSGDSRFVFRHEWTDAAAISPQMRVAVIASEDQKFPYHRGFDFDQIQTALDEAEDGKRQRGASTISQQVAKNLFLWQGHTFLRKGVEAYLTVLIEWLWPKERILEVYLNVAEFGHGVYGVGAASRAYFRMSPARLNRYQAALLAAVLPNPKRLRADAPSNYVLRRRDWIADQMEGLGGPAYLAELRNPHPEELALIKKRRR